MLIPAREAFGLPGICLSLADRPEELAALAHYWRLIERNRRRSCRGGNIPDAAGAGGVHPTAATRSLTIRGQRDTQLLKLFQRFNQLIDGHYHQHWTVPDYASELHLTESG